MGAEGGYADRATFVIRQRSQWSDLYHGGQDALDDRLRQLATVEVYDPATDTWKKLPDMPAL